MPLGGEGGGHGCAVQDHPPVTDRRHEDVLPHSTPPLSAVASQDKKQELPVASLPEGPLVEILARVPYRSLCRFKCVSKPWLALCSSGDIRRRSPQTLSGFFYQDTGGLHFWNLSGRGPPLVDPLSFLRQSYTHICVEQFGYSLLLCTCWNTGTQSDYLVCNPATQEWTVLPPLALPDLDFVEHGHMLHFKPIAYLGFDAAAPSRFVVFAPLTSGLNDSREVAIYSSQTGQWAYVQSKWPAITLIDHSTKTRVFLNGAMHLVTLHKSIVTVDTEGKIWREIGLPSSSDDVVSIGLSQRRLYAWLIDDICQLHIWVLEDYGAGKWTLKHSVGILELFRRHCRKYEYSYKMFAIHPDCNVIFLTDGMDMTVSYDLDKREVIVMCAGAMYGAPYIPCFAELLSGGH